MPTILADRIDRGTIECSRRLVAVGIRHLRVCLTDHSIEDVANDVIKNIVRLVIGVVTCVAVGLVTGPGTIEFAVSVASGTHAATKTLMISGCLLIAMPYCLRVPKGQLNAFAVGCKAEITKA